MANTQTRVKVMVVDDDITNLKYAKSALVDTYDVFTVLSVVKMLELLKTENVELILLDVDMPEIDGYEAIRILKEDTRTKCIPVIFLTAKADPDSEISGLRFGAVDYITKPFDPVLLKKRVEVHLTLKNQTEQLVQFAAQLKDYSDNLLKKVEEKSAQVMRLQSNMLITISDLVENKGDDNEDAPVSKIRGILQILISKILDSGYQLQEVRAWDVELLLLSAEVHDVGKVKINDAILGKRGKLTAEEFEVVKTHPKEGVKIIDRISRGVGSAKQEDAGFLKYARALAAHHHERWDGSGYPEGLAGEDIPLLGRLMSIVDVYEALISHRSYRNAYRHEEAISIINDESCKFDPVLLQIFNEVADRLKVVAEG